MSVSLSAAIARIRRPLSNGVPSLSEEPPRSKRHRGDAVPSSSSYLLSPTASSSSSSMYSAAPSSSTPFLPVSSSSSLPASRENLLQIFVHTDAGTVVRHVSPSTTVESLLSSFSASAVDSRILFRGRQLPSEITLAGAGVNKDSTLTLLGRLRSTRLPRAHQLTDNIVRAANDAIQNPRFPPRSAYSIDLFVGDFLGLAPLMQHSFTRAGAPPCDIVAELLRVLIESGAPIALVKLYMCEYTGVCNTIARRAISRFLQPGSRDFLKYAPLLVHFCDLLHRSVGNKDELYLQCRNALSIVVGSVEWQSKSLALSSAGVISQLLPFAQDSVKVLLNGLSSAQMVVTENCVEEFSRFMHALQREVRIWVAIRFANKMEKEFYSLQYVGEDSWVYSLYSMYIELMRIMQQCLDKLQADVQFDPLFESKERHERKSQWVSRHYLLAVLTELSSFSEIYEDEAPLFQSMLREQKGPLDALVRCAKRNRSLSWLKKHKDLLSFDARRNLAYMMFPDGKDDYGELHEMMIDRSKLLAESFEYISQANPVNLRNGMFMEFKNEEATGPGVLREWFCMVCRDLFSPENVLFLSCPNDRRRIFLNPASIVDPLYEKYLIFSGRVIGLALFHKVQVGIVFDRVFFLQLAGEEITLEDIKEADPLLYASCKTILEMDAALIDSDILGLTFVREVWQLGSQKLVELCPGGKDIVVDSKNRTTYIHLLIQERFVNSVSAQLLHFAKGFEDILGNSGMQQVFFQCLKLEDFDQILGGNTSISVTDWRLHTEYNGYEEKDHQIDWFWKVVEQMPPGEQRMLLFFWTSIKYLPTNGFDGLSTELFIFKSNESSDHLPSSHTCFYRLYLPPYSSMSMMRSRLQVIIQDHVSSSFGTW